MPEWLAILVGVLGGVSTITGIFAIWLRPLFKMRKDLDSVMFNQNKDYKARLRNDRLQKAQAKALIALLNNQISGNDESMIRLVRDELQAELMELI